ncbi:MAG: hypothetical protein JO215_03130 [Ktedonobacteraceae bacterium]|nr:hypothetical protein [Ktedonobacteraceae bacterium]
MPKKAATARSGAQRNRAKAQKSFEVVRQNSENQELTENEPAEVTPISTPTPSAEVSPRPTRSERRAATRASVVTPEVATENDVAPENEAATAKVEDKNEEVPTPVAKASISARLASRHGQRSQQRAAATLITAEHYTYVTRDLIIIAILASIMFIAIIVLYFTIGR